MLANFAAESDKGKNLWPASFQRRRHRIAASHLGEQGRLRGKLAKLSADAKTQDAGVKDLDTFKAAIGEIGKNCGGCHNTYRKKAS